MRRSTPAVHFLLIVVVMAFGAPAVRAGLTTAPPLLAVAYAAPDGDDARDCATPATRCATLRRALAQLAEGGEVRLATGTYAGLTRINRAAAIVGGYKLPGFIPSDEPSVLDGQRRGTTVQIAAVPWALLQRLTITGGLADPARTATGQGGGVSIRGGAVTLDHVQIRGNIADVDSSGRGGGLYIRDGSLLLADSVVMSNTASLGRPVGSMDTPTIIGSGGGIYAINSRLAIRRSWLAGNSAIGDQAQIGSTRGWGGGLYAIGCDLETTAAVFLGNGAGGATSGGGALELRDSRARLLGGEISDNQASFTEGAPGLGGGADILGGTTTIMNVAFRRNAAGNGAGIVLRPPANAISATVSLTLTNVLLAGQRGPALALLPNGAGAAGAAVRYTTLVSNSVGLLAGNRQSIDVANSLIVGGDIAAQALDGGAIELAYTDRYGNGVASVGDVRVGPAGDLALMPRFAPGDAAFRLALDSPLLDRGTLLAGISGDFEGQPRAIDGDGDGVALPDLGWDELARSAATFGPNQTLYALPGQTLTTTLDLLNLGLAADTFQTSVAAPSGWAATVAPSQVLLGSRARARLTITVGVPASAPLNSQGLLVVQATGQTSAATVLIAVYIGEP
jgi:hypothetical protein